MGASGDRFGTFNATASSSGGFGGGFGMQSKISAVKEGGPSSMNHSPLAKAKENKRTPNSNVGIGIGQLSYGGVQLGGKALNELRNKDVGSIVKNKDIFEKAQQRGKEVDWYSKLQDSKDAMMRAEQGKLPIL